MAFAKGVVLGLAGLAVLSAAVGAEQVEEVLRRDSAVTCDEIGIGTDMSPDDAERLDRLAACTIDGAVVAAVCGLGHEGDVPLYLAPTGGFDLLICHFAVENHGDSTLTLASADFKAKDNAPRVQQVFEPSTQASVWLGDDAIGFGRLGPDERTVGTLAFEVPPDAPKPLRIEWHRFPEETGVDNNVTIVIDEGELLTFEEFLALGE